MVPDHSTSTRLETLSSLLEALSSQLVAIDAEGQIVAANAAWRNQTKIADYFTAFQLVFRPTLELVSQLRDGVEQVLAESVPEFVAEFQVTTTREPSWILLRAAPLNIPGTGPRALIAHVDITTRKRAERLSGLQREILSMVARDSPLRAALERLCLGLEEEIPDIAAVILVRVPESETASLGGGPTIPVGLSDQLDGLPITELLHFFEQPATVDLTRVPGVPWVNAALAHGFRSLASSPLLSNNGSALGTLLLMQTVPGQLPPVSKSLLQVGSSLASVAIDRHRSTRAIRERDNRFNSIFTLLPDPVFTLDRDGQVAAANPAAESLMGEHTHDITQQLFEQWVAGDEQPMFRQRLQRVLNGYPERFQLRLRSARDIDLDIDATLVPLVSEGGIGGVYLIAKDVTAQLEAAVRLAETDRTIQHAAKMESVARLAGGIAHDFNDILTAVRGYADLLLTSRSVPEQVRRDVEEISKGIDRASTLANQLLTFTTQQPALPRPLELNALLEDARDTLLRFLRPDVRAEFIPFAAASWIEADPTQLQQVLVNLAAHAQDAMPNGGHLTFEIGHLRVPPQDPQAVVQLGPGEYASLRVADTGPGTGVAGCESKSGDDSTLGLSTVYGLVVQNGGRIGVRSTAGQGTTFMLYFPLKPTPMDQAAAPDSIAFPPGHKTVLLAEDEESVRVLVRRVLSAAGYTVLEARHGADALQVSREFPGTIDLLLTDVVMPTMSGQALGEVIRRERPGTGVVYMSGYSRGELDRSGLPGTGILIRKPFSVGQLAGAIREATATNQGQ